MAVAFRAANGLTPANNTTTAGFALPTGNAATDLLIGVLGLKAYTVDVSSGTFLTDYTLAGNVTDGTVADGVDTGSVRCHVRYREHDGSESSPTGTLSASASPRCAAMVAYTRAGSAWAVAATTASDGTATGTTFSATGAADPGFTSGDVVLAFVSFPTDGATPSSITITVPGCTVGTATQRLTTTITTLGNDAGLVVYEAAVTAGTSTGAPSISITTASGFSSGAAVFMRLRETGGAQLGDGTLTVTPTVSGAGVLTAVAAGTFTAAPTFTGDAVVVGVKIGTGTLTVTPTVSGVGIEVHTGTGSVTVTPTLTGAAFRNPRLGAGTLTVTPTLTGDGTLAGAPKIGAGTLTVTPTVAGAGVSTKVATGQTLAVAPVLDAQASVADAVWFASAMTTVVPTLTGAGITLQAGSGGTLAVTPALYVYARTTPAGGLIMAAAQIADARAQWPDSRNISDGVLTNLLESAWTSCLEYLPAEVTTAVGFAPEDVPAYVQANVLQARDTFTAYERDGDVIGFDQYAVRVRPLSATVRQLLRPSSPAKVG